MTKVTQCPVAVEPETVFSSIQALINGLQSMTNQICGWKSLYCCARFKDIYAIINFSSQKVYPISWR